MSCAHARTSTRASANAQQSGDPTNTLPIRRDFIREIRRRFRRVRGLVRRTVGYENDALRLKQDTGVPTVNAEEQEAFRFTTDEERVEAFRRWFREAAEDEILEPVELRDVQNGEHWTGAYVRSSYEKGWKNGTGRLMAEGVSVAAAEEVFDLPVPKRQIRRLYSRTFDNLRGITEDMADDISRELARGLVEGENPRTMARRINNEVTKIRRTRADVLARTEIINSYSDATLDRYEDAGVDVVSHGEWATAGDRRVCPICQSLEGQTFRINEMRTGTFNFDAEDDDVADSLAGTYQLKPPAHPNGRCAILPVVS